MRYVSHRENCISAVLNYVCIYMYVFIYALCMYVYMWNAKKCACYQ